MTTTFNPKREVGRLDSELDALTLCVQALIDCSDRNCFDEALALRLKQHLAKLKYSGASDADMTKVSEAVNVTVGNTL